MPTALKRLRAMARNVRPATTIGMWVCVAVSVGLFIASFCVPPMGEIDPSVLKAGSLLFAFAALFEVREAIIEGLGVKLTHGDTVIEIRDTDGINADPDPKDPTEIKGEYNGDTIDP